MLKLAEAEGFEPTWGLSPKRFSRPFDKYIISSSYGFFQGILMFQKSQSQQGFFTLNELNIDRNAPFCAKMISKKISKKRETILQIGENFGENFA